MDKGGESPLAGSCVVSSNMRRRAHSMRGARLRTGVSFDYGMRERRANMQRIVAVKGALVEMLRAAETSK